MQTQSIEAPTTDQPAVFTNSVAVNLNAAADLIDGGRWFAVPADWDEPFRYEGELRGHGDTARCALIAIYDADGGVTNAGFIATASSRSFQSYINGENIPSWNNHPTRTKSEVVEALRACALTVEAQS